VFEDIRITIHGVTATPLQYAICDSGRRHLVEELFVVIDFVLRIPDA